AEPRPAPAGTAAPLLTATLTAREAAALDLAARRARAGRHALLLALLAHEAQRRDGRPRLLIGCGVSLRPAAAETAVGLFVHLLPVALTAAPEASLAERIAAAQAGLDAALATAWLPPSLIQADFRRDHPGLRPPELPPLLDLALTAAPSRFHQGDGLALRPRPLPGETALPAAGLTLSFSHEPREDGGIDLALAWRPDRIDQATAQGWLDGFAAWARRLAAAPAGLDAPLPPLRPEEEAWLAEWERGPAPLAPLVAAHRRFEAAVRAAPQHPALVTPGRVFTRAEIDRHADRVADRLRRHGLRPGEPVAVLADTLPALPGAVLGVWKAGGVYLPLPPDLPPARRAAILADAGARRLLVLPGLVAPAGLDPAIAALACPGPDDAADGAEEAPPAAPGEETGAAYLIYTSGTTGTPKGVALRHDALAQVGSETARLAGLGADDRVALAASPGFDASLWEIALALAAGAAWVPVPRGWRDDPWTLRRRYAELGVTVAYLSPSYLRLGAEQSFSGLRVLLTGGEAPTHQDFDRLAATVPTLCNAYGPTEATVLVSIERIAAERDRTRPPSVGRPIPGAIISLRRADGSRVPPGESGEVWLGGLGIAEGYLHQPEQTARRFVVTAEGRFHRSGDLGRWTADGRLEIAGRIDDQIKLHGQRLEPAEIAQALAALPGVAEALVLADRAAAGTQVLRGFVRLAAGAEVPAGWRAALAERLPAYMVPAALTAVAAFPLTANGKTDHAALLALAAAAGDYRPRTPPSPGLETTIAAVWGRLLGAEPAREDDFFALGGNSLLAVTLAHRLGQALGRTVAARDLFAAPTLAGFAARIAAGKEDGAVLERSDRATEGELAFRVAERAGLDTRGFTIPVLRRIDGAVAPERWRAAWAALVERHPGLRTHYVEDDDGSLRRVVGGLPPAPGRGDAPDPLLFPELEWVEVADATAARDHFWRRHAAPLRMDRPPLWRAGLIGLAKEGEVWFWLALHHAIGDGQSVSLLLDELATLVDGGTLAPCQGDFGQAAAREEAYLAGAAAEEDARFWAETLAGVPDESFAEPVTDHPRRADAPAGTHRFSRRLPAAAATRLAALARQQRASLHALLLALLGLEAGRRGGLETVMLGSAVSLRDEAADQGVVGDYVNMIPLPGPGAGPLPFAARLAAAQRGLAAALGHARLPFARINRAFRTARPLPRDPNRYPLFDLAVIEVPPAAAGPARLRPPPEPGSEEGGLGYQRSAVSPGQDMVLIHQAEPDGALLLHWHVNAALFERDTAALWLDALAGWIDWLGEDPARAETPLPPLLPEEARRLDLWQRGEARPRPPLRFHELFERRLDADPAAAARPALIGASGTVSHAALEAEANVIAHALAETGIGAGAVVGVLAGRSAGLPAAVLGIWKAAAIYLPLAADLPPERLRALAADAGAAGLIALDGAVPPPGLPPPLRPEAIEPAFHAGHRHRLDRPGRPEDPAYILYTSGSTGTPKGVVVGHDAYLNTVLGAGEALGFGPDDRGLLFASPAFDVSLSDFGLPLAFGGAACAVPAELLEAPDRFRAMLAERGVTVADITPSYLRLLGPAPFPTLRAIVTGGEPPLAADIRAHAGRLTYLNAYGPTEAAITATMGRLAPAAADGPPPAGRPLPNTLVELVDRASRPLPPGAVGEIRLGGAGLAQAYLGRPDLTEAAFPAGPAGRRYRTGDLGRWNAAGELVVLGRADDQIKRSGVRIEPGEIIHAIERHPAVAQATVLLDHHRDGDGRLWGFVRLHPGRAAPAEAEWRAFLAARLPPALLPSAVIAVESLPVTASGKIDAAALLALVAARRQESAAPVGPLETAIATVWAELLGGGAIGRDEDFFARGGHSLLAIAAAHRLERELGRPVPAREMFAAPTVRAFAARLAALPAAPPVVPTDRATEGQRGFWLADRIGLDTRGFTVPLALWVEEADGGPPDPAAWRRAWTALVARHQALRVGFVGESERELRRIALTVPPERFELSEHPDAAAALAHGRARQAVPLPMAPPPGEAAPPPPWRAGLARVTGARRALLWVALHHALGDGVSLGVMVADLARLRRGETLAPLGEPLDRLAGREEAYLAGPDGAADAAYWRTALGPDSAGHDPAVPADWPLDHPRPLARGGDNAKGTHVLRGRLPPAEAEALRAFARARGAGLHALWLTLLALEAWRRGGQAAPVIGTAASLRDRAEDGGAVGLFINLIPLPLRIDPAAPVERLLADTQARLAAGLGHARYPFGRIFADLRARNPAAAVAARHPLFDLAVTETPDTAGDDGAGPRFFEAAVDEPDRVRRPFGPPLDMLLSHERAADGGLMLRWFVDATLYEGDTAQAWLDGLLGWARWLIAPDRVADSPPPRLLPDEIRRLAGWEQGPPPRPDATDLVDRFARWVERAPDRPALISAAGPRSRGEIAAAAATLAARLRAAGVRRGDRVGVLTLRSATLPETVLGVWQAGAVYLPLTADLPPERLGLIARDAGVRRLVALDGLTPPPPLAALPRLDWPDRLARPAPRPGRAPAPAGGDPAYILYTSGSTGRPKGVVLLHRGLANFATGMADRLGLGEDDRVLLAASPSFDAWIGDLAMAWAAGAAVVPVSRAEIDDIPAMHARLAGGGVTVATLTPSYLRLFDRADFPGLRLLMTVGEPPDPGDARHYAARLAHFNGYGPTENSIAASAGRIDPAGDGAIDAGPPLPGVTIAIRDRDGRPLPPGAVGEIRLGGIGLAQGYLGRPDLTATAFPTGPEGRSYRSGDLGRWSPDGRLVLLGREDDQIKLRGQRIELGEIAGWIETHPAVRRAVALVAPDRQGRPGLWAAFVRAADQPAPDAAEWRTHLAARLPAHMVPAAVIELAEIPLGPAGKVDRAALAALIAARRDGGAGAEATPADAAPPPDETERRIGRLWGELLGRDRIGPDEDFFALGGDSLRAIALIARLRSWCACSITALYEHPRLRAFAATCRPEPAHLQACLAGARAHWQAFADHRADYEARRTEALESAFAAYRARSAALPAPDPARRRAYRRVLLTGATGYLGAYLLRELAEDPERRIDLLIRADDPAAARARLAAVLTHYFGAEAGRALALSPRLALWTGDLRREDLGLSATARAALTDGCAAIFHCAADVRHYGRWEEFAAANVAGTARLLDLAGHDPARPADFHQISTLSVAGRAPETGFVLFDEDSPAGTGDENYYVRAKQAAERLALAARGRLANVCLHRVGNVVFAAEGEALQRDIASNAFFRLLAALIRLGAAPDESHVWLCHADVAARAVARLALAADLTDQTHHIEPGRRDSVAALLAPAGIETLDFAAFLDRLDRASTRPELAAAVTNAMGVFGLFDAISPQERGRRHEITSERTLDRLARLGVAWPDLPATGLAATLRRAAQS
ncbi:amino acid adenylation domain-containing protein, partial [Phaeospirillum tilakii]